MAKVRMIHTAADGKNIFLAGDIHDVADATATDWVVGGVAEWAQDEVRCCTKAVPCKAVKKGATPR